MKLLRPPAPEVYERMSQTLRLSVAQLLEDQIALVERERAHRRAAAISAAQRIYGNGTAQQVLDVLTPDHPNDQAARRAVLERDGQKRAAA